MTVTLTSWLPQLHPPQCNHLHQDSCERPNNLQLRILWLGLGLLSIGAGGIRPCSIPFGADQFDQQTQQGLKGMASYFNWYYFTFSVVLIISHTVIVYIQDNISWVIGFSVPTCLMACAIVLFFVGMRFYVYVKPEGSVFSTIVRVIVAARKKRNLKVPAVDDGTVEYYDPPVKPGVSKLPLTDQFRYLLIYL